KKAENDLKRRTHDLGERVKELHCLYNISKIVEEMGLSIEETTQRIVNLIPPAWQYPESTCARIILQGKEFKTKDFETSVWKQVSDIKVYGKVIGTIEVYYSEEKATDFEGPFMKEEQDLIEVISERLGRIIERKQAEEEKQKLETQLVQAQKMEAIGTLAGGIAHDFNNILGGIIGYAELAKMKAPQESNVVADLNQVIQSGNRAVDLIKQILTISRQHKQEKRPVQLRYIVNEALKLLRATLPTTIEIREDLAKDSGVVNADPTQMHQVIMNLGTNASHAMEKNGGVLEVSLVNVEMDGLSASKYLDMDAGYYLRLTVSDTGHGMALEIVERIFDPYFTTKDIGEGTGLGLSVAQGIVKAHGGTIIVYSELGNGTTFHVYLPVIQETEKEEKKESKQPLPTGNERILFIDDEQILVEIGSQMLERLGYKVVTKRSSVQALELFRAEPDRFDLVITDMTMPHMTGDNLAQELFKIRPDIPVMAETVRKALDAG
ncbi:MAG: response regulator, partial [Deltaproteobacteria bacterium]|nr:response regulator [Deltaproteobacteria bacterium]